MSTQKLQPFIAATWCWSSSCSPGSTPPGLPDRPKYMPSCAAIDFGKRAKTTLAGVMALPNWRFMAQYMSFTTGFVGFSMGVSRMIVTSNHVGRGVRMLRVTPAVVDERKGGQERPERD